MAQAQTQQRPQLDPAQAARLFFNPGSPLDPPSPDQQNPQQQNVQPTAATSAAQPQQNPQQAAAPQNPSFAQPSPGPMSRADFFQQNPHATDAYMPARPVSALDNVHGFRKALALAFGGLANFGANLRGGHDPTLENWTEQSLAQRNYDANRGRYQAEAGNQAYGNYLGEAEKTAQTRLTGAQADIVGQNLPAQEQAQKLHGALVDRWQSGIDASPEAFQQYAHTQLSAAPGPVGRMVAPMLGDILKLPQRPPAFKIEGGAVQPITYKGAQYGVTPQPNEPAEITQARKNAMDSQQAGEFAKASPEIVAQIGAYPTNGTPAEKAAWGKKAEDIKVHESAAPKIMVQNAQNGPLGGPMQIPQGVTGEAALANVDHATAAGVRMIGDGKADFATFTSRMPPQAKMNLAALVHAYNPDFDQNTFTIRKGVETSFTSGDYSKNVTALNTALEHMKVFSDLADALHNGDAQLINKLGNSVASQTGSAAPTNFAMARDAFSGEVGKAFAGANVAEGDRKQVAEAINSAESPEQLKGAAQTATRLLQGKLNALRQTYEAGQQNKPAFQETGGQPQQDQLPPQAAAALQEGHETTFANGQVWTKKNGQATRVK